MPFFYPRTVRFHDTDAAGVVYFANVLSICHEAYEASLIATGLDVKNFFSGASIAIPIVHADIDFFQPMYCGQAITVRLTPTLLSANKYEIAYEISGEIPYETGNNAPVNDPVNQLIGRATTIHLCINPVTRDRATLPAEILQWLQHHRED